jgi:hypothetical protein
MKTLKISKSRYGEGLYFAALREDDLTIWVGTEGTEKEVRAEIKRADIQTPIE